jgi:hypothetical protein
VSADLMSEKRTGRPRQRAQGSLRRSPRDVGDRVGESYLLRHNILKRIFGIRSGVSVKTFSSLYAELVHPVPRDGHEK